MADIVTGTTTGQVDLSAVLAGQHASSTLNANDHADIRSEGFEQSANIRAEGFQQTSDIRRDVLGGMADTRFASASQSADIRRENAITEGSVINAVKSSGWANSDRTGTEADRVVAQDTAYFIASQSQNFQNATALAALKAAQDAGFARAQADTQIAAMQAVAAAQLEAAKTTGAIALDAAKNTATLALGQANLGAQIAADGNVTRALIHSLKHDDKDRELIERNAQIVEERGYGRFWQHGANNAQFAAVTSQLNAFQSQLQETRQGMVNFGTMAGVGQTSTSNNVR